MAIAPDRLATEPAEASAIAVICDLPFEETLIPSLPERLAFSSTKTVALFSVTEMAATKAAPAEFDCDVTVLCVTASELTASVSPASISVVPSMMISEVE